MSKLKVENKIHNIYLHSRIFADPSTLVFFHHSEPLSPSHCLRVSALKCYKQEITPHTKSVILIVITYGGEHHKKWKISWKNSGNSLDKTWQKTPETTISTSINSLSLQSCWIYKYTYNCNWGEQFAQFLATSKLTSYKRRSQHCSSVLVCKYLLDLLGSLEGLNKSLMNILEQFFFQLHPRTSHGFTRAGCSQMVDRAVPGIQLLWWFARTLSREKTGDSDRTDSSFFWPLFGLQALVPSRRSFPQSLGRVAVQHRGPNGGVENQTLKVWNWAKPNNQQPNTSCYLLHSDPIWFFR